ncbi:MAG: fatty acyl-AMP ligase [Candidatus Sericytochromatia bacterium]
MNLVDIFYKQVKNNPDKVVYTHLVNGEDEVKTVTYKQLCERAESIAIELQKNYKVGDKALLLFDTGLDFVSSLWACFISGIIAVPIHPPIDMRSLTKLLGILKDSKANVVITTQDFVNQMAFVKSSIPDAPDIGSLAVDKIDITGSTFISFKAEDSSHALIQYTSGSIGMSKGVLLTHNNIVYNAYMLKAVLDEIPPPNAEIDSFCCWLPLYHDMGLMSGVILPLVMGTSSVLMSPLMFLQKPVRWLKAISKYKATVSAAPNFAYELCIKKTKEEQLNELDLSTWSVALNGAEAVRSNTIKNFTDKFSVCGFKHEYFFPAYGLAESVVFVTGPSRNELPIVLKADKESLENHKILETNNNDNSVDIVSIGHIWLEEKVKIVNPETLEECNADEIGEVWVNSQAIAYEYLNMPEESEYTFNAFIKGNDSEKYLRTGDLGFFKGRNLFITGRIKDLIIIRGKNHYPHHIEITTEKFSEHFRLGSNAAFSVNHENEEKLVVVQEIKNDTKISNSDELKQSLKNHITEEHGITPHDIVFIRQGSIFKTSSGKVQRRLCQNKYIKGQLELWK